MFVANYFGVAQIYYIGTVCYNAGLWRIQFNSLAVFSLYQYGLHVQCRDTDVTALEKTMLGLYIFSSQNVNMRVQLQQRKEKQK